MAYRYDNERIDAHDFERSEAAWARHTSPPLTCADGHHSWSRNNHGGLTCWRCGDDVSGSEA